MYEIIVLLSWQMNFQQLLTHLQLYQKHVLLLALLKTVVLLHIFTESSTKSHKQANVINNYKEMTSETELNKTEIASSCKM